MKIIKFNPKNPYSDRMYDALDNILEFGMNHLPFIFFKKVPFEGELFDLPRWITIRRMDEIDENTQELIKQLNWEENGERN